MTSSKTRPPRASVLRAEGHQRKPDVLLEVRVEEQHLVLPDRPVVVEDHLAVPESAHDLREVLHLGGRHRRDPERRIHRRDTTTETECEPSTGQAVHRGRPRSGDQRVAGVVIGCGGGDLHAVGDRKRRTDERGRLLDVPPLGDEAGAETQLLTAARLRGQRRRPLATRACEEVVAQLVEHPFGHCQTPLFVAAVPDFGDPAVDDAEDLHAADVGLGAVLQFHRRLVDDRDVLAVVAGHHEVQIEPDGAEHLPVIHDPRDRLLVGQRGRLPHLVADHRVAHQLLGEVEVALVPDDQVVQLDDLTGGPCHANTSSASISSMAATARSVNVRHSALDRSGIASQPLSVITGSTIR